MIDIIPVTNLWLDGHSQILENIIFNYDIKKMAEIGVYKAENMRSILRSTASNVLTEYIGIDPWAVNEDHLKRGTEQVWYEMYYGAVKYMPWFKQLKILRLYSEEASKLFMNEYFDMVFIDGDHHYESVKKDILCWLPKVKKGGIIAGHDYVNSPDEIPKIYGNKYNDDYHKNYIMGINKAVHEIFGNDFIRERCTVWYKRI